MTPAQAYAPDEAAREYPALPALHPRLAAMSVDAVRAEAHLAAPLPQTFAPKAPAARRSGASITDEQAKRAGFASAAEHAAALDKHGPPPGMEISQ